MRSRLSRRISTFSATESPSSLDSAERDDEEKRANDGKEATVKKRERI